MVAIIPVVIGIVVLIGGLVGVSELHIIPGLPPLLDLGGVQTIANSSSQPNTAMQLPVNKAQVNNWWDWLEGSLKGASNNVQVPDNLPTGTTQQQLQNVENNAFNTADTTKNLGFNLKDLFESLILALANPLHVDPLIIKIIAIAIALIVIFLIIKRIWWIVIALAGITFFIVIISMVLKVANG